MHAENVYRSVGVLKLLRGKQGISYHIHVLYINNNNNNQDDIYSAVIMTTGHCKSSPGSFDELQNSAKQPPTLRPSHLTWAVSSPIGSYRLQPPLPFIIITHPES